MLSRKCSYNSKIEIDGNFFCKAQALSRTFSFGCQESKGDVKKKKENKRVQKGEQRAALETAAPRNAHLYPFTDTWVLCIHAHSPHSPLPLGSSDTELSEKRRLRSLSSSSRRRTGQARDRWRGSRPRARPPSRSRRSSPSSTSSPSSSPSAPSADAAPYALFYPATAPPFLDPHLRTPR